MVHIVLFHYCTAEQEDTDVVGVYADINRARSDMRKFMRDLKKNLLDNNYDSFDADFEQDCDDYISFGFYGVGSGMDHSWAARVESCEVI